MGILRDTAVRLFVGDLTCARLNTTGLLGPRLGMSVIIGEGLHLT